MVKVRTPLWMLEHWRKYQCAECRSGDRTKCSATRKNARAIRVDESGKEHYYCFVGCMLLHLTDAERLRFTEAQFNSEGHYEMLKNSKYAARI